MPAGQERNPWYTRPNSLAVEMTSYAMLTYLQRGLINEAIPIMHWLVAQRNANGGFVGTQDTVLGMQALASLLERISAPPGNVVVTFSYRAGGGQTSSISINRVNSMILQKQEVSGPGRGGVRRRGADGRGCDGELSCAQVPRGVREVEISATGSGVALVQV